MDPNSLGSHVGVITTHVQSGCKDALMQHKALVLHHVKDPCSTSGVLPKSFTHLFNFLSLDTNLYYEICYTSYLIFFSLNVSQL
ncbi:hypothetical protein INR49_030886 [Caranx melampygus]|nr:hypothetical protein INR49_030886 [Caranx melampygus]